MRPTRRALIAGSTLAIPALICSARPAAAALPTPGPQAPACPTGHGPQPDGRVTCPLCLAGATCSDHLI